MNLSLSAKDLSESAVEVDCDPMVTNGSLLLNPCGLIANSLFNGSFASHHVSYPLNYPNYKQCDVFPADIITLKGPVGAELDEKGISWPSDRNTKFQQVDGFKSVSTCMCGLDICDLRCNIHSLLLFSPRPL